MRALMLLDAHPHLLAVLKKIKNGNWDQNQDGGLSSVEMIMIMIIMVMVFHLVSKMFQPVENLK